MILSDSETINSSISSDEVLAFLKENPDFLAKNPQACDLLHPAVSKEKGIVDFQSFMVQRLKDEKASIVATTREIVESSRSNMQNQARIHDAVLRLLEAQSFDEFIMALTMDISAILDVDITTLVVEADGQQIPHIHSSGIRVVPEGVVSQWMGDKSIMLESNIQGLEAIFGGGATLVASQALLRVDISMNTPPALLAFGSRDPKLFEDGQATDQVIFLARVVERCFRTWLSLPQ